jgi:D-beta-D-heptose 7-phosphate kinase/D-beta-D-heptose 1-phosphate adenosyltransferase
MNKRTCGTPLQLPVVSVTNDVRTVEAFEEPREGAVARLLGDVLGRNVVVVGDVMLDRYVTGSVDRVSPEAPVPVVNFAAEHYSLGGAASIAQCAAALGARVELIGVIGADVFGAKLRAIAMAVGIQVESLLVDRSRPTTSKTRIVANGQHVARVDRESREPISEMMQASIILEVERCGKSADAFILADYAKGVLSHSVCQSTIRAATGRPVVVDPKGLRWDRYRRATIIKPNTKEAEAICGHPILTHDDAANFAETIGRDLEIDHVMVTLGKQGAVLMTNSSSVAGRRAVHFPSRTHEVFDVTGAGDTVAGTLAAALAAGANINEAAWLANAAAGVCVGRLGAAPVSQQDIIAALDDCQTHSAHKVISRLEAVRLAAKLKVQGKTIVFTNGCFDLLHVGHVTTLEQSRREGDALFVGVNTDDSVRRLKGPNRPIQPESDRARIVASQRCVDAVILFDEETPYRLIQSLQPNVITKGADYSQKEDVIGWDVVEAHGGRVRLLDRVEGRSTVDLIRRTSTIASASATRS